MCADLWHALGIAPTLQINTLGDIDSRHRHRAKLVAYFERIRTRSTRTRSGGCTAIRCAYWIVKIRRCRR